MTNEGSNTGSSRNSDPSHDADGSKRFITRGRLKLGGLIGVVLIVTLVIAGMLARASDDAAVAKWTQQQLIPTVSIIQPTGAVSGGGILLPGRVEAFYRAPIYARVSGYLKAWYTDIGTRVKTGQLLAIIETPDLDQQLEQAKEELATAHANESLAETTAQRWQLMLQADSVSKQSEAEKSGDLAAKRTMTAAAEANLQRLQALEGFKRIVAPFDGVVTARDTDVGALINAGSGSGLQLFTVSDIHQLRVYISVPQDESASIHQGMSATLTVPEHPDQTFTATVDGTSDSVNAQSGTLLVELLLADPRGSVTPGDYATVRLDLPVAAKVVSIPASALIFRSNGLEVACVDANHKVSLRAITVERDLGTSIEIASGLSVQDRIIDNPPEDIANGDPVQEMVATAKGDKAKAKIAPEPADARS